MARLQNPFVCRFLLVFVAIAPFVRCVGAAATHAPATVTVTRQTIKTYPFSDPDPVPIVVRKGGAAPESPIYPYFFYDGYSKVAVDKEWTVVRLENPWIEVLVLPEVGGKVWGAREKSTGREFIYTNHALKFRQIGLRGPWTSGGIEFNFGVMGHAPTCATPVDWLTRMEADGTATCVVGALDLPSRTRWSVTIALPPDKAYFETRAFWHNPTPLHQSYYNWMNAAVRVGEDLQYAFPGDRSIGHNFEETPRPWPVDGGRDLTWYKNHDFGSYQSYFTFGERRDFFGGYWHGARFGFGHWARAEDVPGRKLWIWGLSREGMIWENLLTDEDGQYSEPQAGRYLNQSDTAFFQPGAADQWREIWFPYKEIGPIMAASPWGVMNVTTTPQSMTIGVCALQALDEDIWVSNGTRELMRDRLRLKPLEVYRKTIPVRDWGIGLLVSVGDGAKEKLKWENLPIDMLRRPIRFHEYSTETAEGIYRQAERLEKGRKFGHALDLYEKCLEKEPEHVRALCRLAEQYHRRSEDERSLNYARRALATDMYDAQANYLYGLAAQSCLNPNEAREGLGWAVRSLEYRSAANCLLAEMSITERRYEEAAEYARRALEANALNVHARWLLAIALTPLDRAQEAQRELETILELDPLHPGARFELYTRLEPNSKRLNEFRQPIANELPQETYLETALDYERLQYTEDAGKVLELAPQTAEILYWRAWLADRRDELTVSAQFLKRASAMSPRLGFPYRPESIKVFHWAEQKNPVDWKPKYYLGLIYLGLGRTAEARELFAKCGEPDFAPFYLLQGRLTQKENPARALEFFKKALEKDRKEWRAWHALIGQELALEKKDEALKAAREAAEAFPKSDELRLDLIKALIANGKDEAALELLNHSAFLPMEGASEVHEIYVGCLLRLGAGRMRVGDYVVALKYFERARGYPETLGSGRPYEPDLRAQDYLQALCLEKMGRDNEARKALQAAIEYTKNHKGGKWRWFGALALRKAGEEAEARAMLDRGEPTNEIRELLEGIAD